MKKLMAMTLAVLLALTLAACTLTTVRQPNENQPAVTREAVKPELDVQNQEPVHLLNHYLGDGAKDNEDCAGGNGAVRTRDHFAGDFRAVS